MEFIAVRKLVEGFNGKGVRYSVAGGLAVVAHGYVRYTADDDLIFDPHPDNLKTAIEVLQSLGYSPRAPVPFIQLSDAAARHTWALDKHMVVFSVATTTYPDTGVVLFLEPPFEFEPAYQRAEKMEIVPGVLATFCYLHDLLSMKRVAARPRDIVDIDELLKIHPELH